MAVEVLFCFSRVPFFLCLFLGNSIASNIPGKRLGYRDRLETKI